MHRSGRIEHIVGWFEQKQHDERDDWGGPEDAAGSIVGLYWLLVQIESLESNLSRADAQTRVMATLQTTLRTPPLLVNRPLLANDPAYFVINLKKTHIAVILGTGTALTAVKYWVEIVDALRGLLHLIPLAK